jgi:hypothetical protein
MKRTIKLHCALLFIFIFAFQLKSSAQDEPLADQSAPAAASSALMVTVTSQSGDVSLKREEDEEWELAKPGDVFGEKTSLRSGVESSAIFTWNGMNLFMMKGVARMDVLSIATGDPEKPNVFNLEAGSLYVIYDVPLSKVSQLVVKDATGIYRTNRCVFLMIVQENGPTRVHVIEGTLEYMTSEEDENIVSVESGQTIENEAGVPPKIEDTPEKDANDLMNEFKGMLPQDENEGQSETEEAPSGNEGSAPLVFTTTIEAAEVQPPPASSIQVCNKFVTGDSIDINGADLIDGKIVVTGSAVSADKSVWIMGVMVDGAEMPVEAGETWKAVLPSDSADRPETNKISIGGKLLTDAEDMLLFSKDDLVNRKLVISGPIPYVQAVHSFEVNVKAASAAGNEVTIKNFAINYNGSGLSKVDVSLEPGSWVPAQIEKDRWFYNLDPSRSNGNSYSLNVVATDYAGLTSDELIEPYRFKYCYKTPAELLRATFDYMLGAFEKGNWMDFMNNVDEEFQSAYDTVRDYDQLKDTIKDKATCCKLNFDYIVQNVSITGAGTTGEVEFHWWNPLIRESSNAHSGTYLFNHDIEKEQCGGEGWLLTRVEDPQVFLALSKSVVALEIEADALTLTADTEDHTQIRVKAYDYIGAYPMGGIRINFMTTLGQIESSSILEDGETEVTFTAGAKSGTARITAGWGSVLSNTIEIELLPFVGPEPPK